MTDKSKAKQYERIKLILSLSETALIIILLVYFIFSGLSIELKNRVLTITDSIYAGFFIYVAALAVVLTAISVIFSFISGYYFEHRYHLSNQSFWAWTWETFKGLVVGLVLSIPLLFLFFYFINRFPQTWWIWMGAAMFVFSVLLSRIAPQVIFPLFYKFEPVDNPEILERMQKLAKKGKFTLKGIFRFNMSKDTVKANAAFTGIGKSKRIILGDNLLNSFSADEIEAVFAHEVGHFVHLHILIRLFTGTFSSFLIFFLADFLYNIFDNSLGFNGITDMAGLPLLVVLMILAGFVITPFDNALSRHHERQADRYAVLNSSNPQAFITSMKKLSDINLADTKPNAVVEFLFHGHPAIDKRIRFANDIINESQK